MLLLYFPATQGAQSLEESPPAVGLLFPFTHEVQSDDVVDPVSMLNLPAMQLVQVEVPALAAYLPVPHKVQSYELSLPVLPLVLFPYNEIVSVRK